MCDESDESVRSDDTLTTDGQTTTTPLQLLQNVSDFDAILTCDIVDIFAAAAYRGKPSKTKPDCEENLLESSYD